MVSKLLALGFGILFAALTIAVVKTLVATNSIANIIIGLALSAFYLYGAISLFKFLVKVECE